MTTKIQPSQESQTRLFSMLGKNITAIEQVNDLSTKYYQGHLLVNRLIFTFEDEQAFVLQADSIDTPSGIEAFVVDTDLPHPVRMYPGGPIVGPTPITELSMFVGAEIDDIRMIAADWIVVRDIKQRQDMPKFLGKNPRWLVLVSSNQAETLDQSYQIEDGLMFRFTNGGVMLIQASRQLPLSLDVWHWASSE